MGCGASSDAAVKQRQAATGAADSDGGTATATAQRGPPRSVQTQGNTGAAEPTDATDATAAAAPSAAPAGGDAASEKGKADAAGAPSIPPPNATLAKVGTAISTTSSIVNGVDAGVSGALGALATKNPDGSYTLKDSLGPVDLRSPALRRVLGQTLFGLSKVLQVSQAGKVLCMVLETCYKTYNCSSNKPRWMGEFCLYLKTQEHELLDGRAQFQRQGFLNRVDEELRRVARRMEQIGARSTVSSFVFALADQESLQRSRATIEKLKSQALLGLVTEVAETGADVQNQLRNMLADLELRRSGAGGGDEDTAAAAAAELVRASVREFNEQRQLMLLLSPLEFLAELERHSSCFCPGTRRTLLGEFGRFSLLKTPPSGSNKHVYDEHRERVFFLVAAPGCGKTTLAAQIASTHPASVVAVHFCRHGLASRNDPTKIVKSLLFQLCNRVPAFGAWFLKALDATPAGQGGRGAGPSGTGAGGPTLREKIQKNKVGDVRQFFIDTFVRGLCAVNAQALAAVAAAGGDPEAARGILPDCVLGGGQGVVVASHDGTATTTAAPPTQQGQKVLVLIDSLDEGISSGDDDLLRVVSDAPLLAKLPPWVGFVITSRMEGPIIRAMRHYHAHKLDGQSSENNTDLELFLRRSLSPLVEAGELDASVAVVRGKSEGMFLYARCVVGLATEIVADNNGERMSLAQVEALPHDLGDFFRAILQRIKDAFPDDESAEGEADAAVGGKASFANVVALLRVVLAALEPLTVAQLALVLGLEVAVVQQLLLPLRSMLPLRPPAASASTAEAAETDNASSSSSAAAADDSLCTVVLFHKSLHDWLTDPVRKSSTEEVDFFVDTSRGHGLLRDACVRALFVRPEPLRPGAQAAAEEFPLLRVGAVLASSPASMEHYALRHVCAHALALGDLPAVEAALCSLEYAMLKVELNQSGELLRDLASCIAAMDGNGGGSLGKKAGPGAVHKLRGMQRFFQAEVRHLTHGFLSESQGALVFQYAASYPPEHPACKQANHPSVRALWASPAMVGAADPSAAVPSPLSVDHVEWLNRPTHPDALLEAWTELGPPQLCLAYHPDPHAHLLAAGGADGSLAVYDTLTRGLVRSFPAAHPGARCTAVAFMRHGDLLASAGSDGLIRAWALGQEGDAPLATIPPPRGASDADADAEDAAAEEEGCLLRPQDSDSDSSSNADPPRTPGPLTSLCFSSDAGSSFLVAGSADGCVYLYARKSLRLAAVLAPEHPAGNGGVTAVAFSHDTTTATSATTHHRLVKPMSFGLIAAAAADGSLRMWELDLSKGQCGPARALPAHNSALECVAFSRDNRMLVAGGRDAALLVHDLTLHDAAPPRRLEGHGGAVLSVDFSPSVSGGVVAEVCSSSADETVRTWILSRSGSWTSGSVFTGHHLPVCSVRYAPAASASASSSASASAAQSQGRIASASLDESIRVWDAHAHAHATKSISGTGLKAPSASESKRSRCWNVTGVVFDPSSPGGDRILSVSEDRALRTWDASTAIVVDIVEALPFVPHHLLLGRCGGADAGKMVAVLASRDADRVVVYAAGAQSPSASAQVSAGVACMAASAACDQVVVGCADRTVHVLNVGAEGASLSAVVAAPPQPLEAEVRCVGFRTCTEGAPVCAVLANESVAIVTDGGEVQQSVRRADASPTARNFAASLSPFDDRTLVASADELGVVRVWSRVDGAVAATLRTACGGVARLHWSDNRTLLIATAQHSVLVWPWQQIPSRPLLSLSGHDDIVTCLAAHSGRVVSGSLDNRIVVWHTGSIPDRGAASAAAPANDAAGADSSAALHSFLFESERAATTGTMHLYRCHAGAQRLRMAPQVPVD